MPLCFECSECKLKFDVGWYHYHDFSSGYGSCTLLSCTACGTQHGIKYALKDRGNAFIPICNVQVTGVSDPNRLKLASWLYRRRKASSLKQALDLTRSLPTLIAQQIETFEIAELSKELMKIPATFEVIEVSKRPNPVYGPILNDCLFHVNGPRHTTDAQPDEHGEVVCNLTLIEPSTEALDCQYCFEEKTLKCDYHDGDQCAHCKNPTLREISGWIT